MARNLTWQFLCILVTTWLSAFVQKSNANEVPSTPQIGHKLSGFQLKDYRGRDYTLGEFSDRHAIVVAFLGTECPLVKMYGPRLSKLAKEYDAKGVAFIGVNSNTQDSISEISAYARAHLIEFPILKDLKNELADEMGALRTPQVFVLDKHGVIRYSGRIDDQFGVGYSRDVPTQLDLRNALDELLSGKAISTPVTEAVGCHIGRIQKPAESGDITYSKQIVRIFNRACVECHRSGEIAPFALTDYDEIVGWADTISEVVQQNRMPPWHATPESGKFANERRLSSEEKAQILQWVSDGAPRGEDQELPPPPEFVAGWQLPKEPDVVITINKEPFKVPAEGTVRYQFFRVDPGFTEDKWISAAQLVPGNRQLVHHILAFALPVKNLRERLEELDGGRRGFLIGFVPGQRNKPFPPGMAKHIPAGSQLLFQVHYTPNGTEQFDQSKLGLVFADPKTITHEVRTSSSATRSLTIPPHDDNHRVEATTIIRENDALLLTFMPHMHVRGKSFFYEAVYADDRKETLLDVPNYDFNWQTAYRLSAPKPLPPGTRVHCVAHFDNSEKNLNNPDPDKTVRWGDQTWDEMMIGYFDLAIPLSSIKQDTEKKATLPVSGR